MDEPRGDAVRWAVAGWGAGGRVFHAPLLTAAHGLDLAAVVSTNPERAAQARAAGHLVVPDLAALVDHGVDGVTVTTPARTHVPLALEALAAGLHVVVDKPFALTGTDAELLVRTAEDRGQVLTAYQNRRWDGDFLTVADELRSGRVGEVLRVVSRIERFEPALPAWTREVPSEQGGGVLVDLGPHLIDQLVHLLGPVASVAAELTTTDPRRASEDDVVLQLRHVGGALSTVVASVRAATEGPRFQVNGTTGGVLIEGFDVQEAQLFAGVRPGDPGWAQEPASRPARVRTREGWSVRPLLPGRWDTFYPAVAAAVRDGAPAPVDPWDSVHVARVFDAARRSGAEGRRVEVVKAASA